MQNNDDIFVVFCANCGAEIARAQGGPGRGAHQGDDHKSPT
jgi:ribosomal protein S27E